MEQQKKGEAGHQQQHHRSCCQHEHHHHDVVHPTEHPSTDISKGSPLERFLQDNSKDPGATYALLTAHPELASQENVSLLSDKVKAVLQQREEVLRSKRKNRAQVVSSALSLARLLYFKQLVLQFCCEKGVESFFESLQSFPPDETATRFQTMLQNFPPKQQ
ncbi:hypothetical protein QOT17_021319 [Balamuthia mandrillaris]